MHAFPDQNAPTTEERTDANASNSGRSNDSSVAIPRAIAEPDSWVETMLYPIAKQAFKGNPLLIILGSHGLGKSTLAQKVAFARGDEGTRRLVINVRESRASLELIEQRIAGLAGSEVAQTVLVLDDVRDDLITPLVRQFRSLGQSPLIGLIIVGHAWAQPMRSEHAIRLEPLLEDDARALLTRHLEAGKSKPRFDDLVAAIMRTAGRHPRLMLGYTEQLRTAWLAASFDAESHIKKLNSSAGMGGHDQAPVYDEVEKMISLIQDHKPLALALVRLSCFVGPFNEAAAMAVLDGAPDAFEHVRGWLDEVKLGNGIIGRVTEIVGHLSDRDSWSAV